MIQTAQPNGYPSGLKYANISLIFIILILIIPSLSILLLFSALIYALAKLLKITPIYSKIAQSYVFITATKIITGANYVVKPVLFIRSITAAVKKGATILRESLHS